MAFEDAFRRYVRSQKVEVPLRSDEEVDLIQKRPKNGWSTLFTTDEQPQLSQASGLKLMDFQIDGVNWLCRNWWNFQNCILADEMGLVRLIATVLLHNLSFFVASGQNSADCHIHRMRPATRGLPCPRRSPKLYYHELGSRV